MFNGALLRVLIVLLIILTFLSIVAFSLSLYTRYLQ